MLKHRKKTEGELRNVEFALALCYAILPQSPSVTAPSRREPIFNLPDKPEFTHLLFKVFWSAEPFFQKRFCVPVLPDNPNLVGGVDLYLLTIT